MSTALQNLVNRPYKHGFVTEIESDVAPKGLNEDTIRLISIKKNEPQWLLEFRLEAYRDGFFRKLLHGRENHPDSVLRGVRPIFRALPGLPA